MFHSYLDYLLHCLTYYCICYLVWPPSLNKHTHTHSLCLRHILKLINHLCVTRWTPPEYWQTDNSNGLVMVIRNYHWLNSSTCSVPLVHTGERKRTQFFTAWPWPLTYDLDLQSQASQGQGRPSCQKSRSKVKWTDTHTRMHTDATKRIISPAMRSIKMQGEWYVWGTLCLYVCVADWTWAWVDSMCQRWILWWYVLFFPSL